MTKKKPTQVFPLLYASGIFIQNRTVYLGDYDQLPQE